MDFNKSSKTDVVKAYQTLLEENLATKRAAEEAVAIANFYGQNLARIELFVKNAPFINQKGKFFKTLFWVISNLSQIREFIEAVVSQIKVWREQVDEMIQKAKEAQEKSNPIESPQSSTV